MGKLFLVVASCSGALTVALGAFGAHGLKGRISDGLLAAYQTGIYYQMFHTLALFALSVLLLNVATTPRGLWVSGVLWILGMVLFSGSLYALALGGPRWLGPVTPLGGIMLIAGWLVLAVGAYQLSDN